MYAKVRLNFSRDNGVCYIGADLVRALGIESYGSATVSLEGNKRLRFKNGKAKKTEPERVFGRSLIEHGENAS
jgi:hypothetical protein